MSEPDIDVIGDDDDLDFVVEAANPVGETAPLSPQKPKTPTAEKSPLRDEQRRMFIEWIGQHPDQLYPNKEEKLKLAEKLGASYVQVTKLLANHRRRLQLRKRRTDGNNEDKENQSNSSPVDDNSTIRTDSPMRLHCDEQIDFPDEEEEPSPQDGDPRRRQNIDRVIDDVLLRVCGDGASSAGFPTLNQLDGRALNETTADRPKSPSNPLGESAPANLFDSSSRSLPTRGASLALNQLIGISSPHTTGACTSTTLSASLPLSSSSSVTNDSPPATTILSTTTTQQQPTPSAANVQMLLSNAAALSSVLSANPNAAAAQNGGAQNPLALNALLAALQQHGGGPNAANMVAALQQQQQQHHHQQQQQQQQFNALNPQAMQMPAVTAAAASAMSGASAAELGAELQRLIAHRQQQESLQQLLADLQKRQLVQTLVDQQMVSLAALSNSGGANPSLAAHLAAAVAAQQHQQQQQQPKILSPQPPHHLLQPAANNAVNMQTKLAAAQLPNTIPVHGAPLTPEQGVEGGAVPADFLRSTPTDKHFQIAQEALHDLRNPQWMSPPLSSHTPASSSSPMLYANEEMSALDAMIADRPNGRPFGDAAFSDRSSTYSATPPPRGDSALRTPVAIAEQENSKKKPKKAEKTKSKAERTPKTPRSSKKRQSDGIGAEGGKRAKKSSLGFAPRKLDELSQPEALAISVLCGLANGRF